MGAGGSVHVGVDLGRAIDVGVDVGQVLAHLVLALQGYMVGMVGYLHFVLRPCSESASRLQLGCEPDLLTLHYLQHSQGSHFGIYFR